jgi:hypothetical protein
MMTKADSQQAAWFAASQFRMHFIVLESAATDWPSTVEGRG